MNEVKLYSSADDQLLKFAVIITQANGKWVLCRHKDRTTYELPVGTEKKMKPFQRLLNVD